MIWLISATLSLPLTIQNSDTVPKVLIFCTSVLCLAVIVIPGAVIAFCYARIVIGVYVFKNICSQGTGGPQDVHKKKSLVKMLFLVTFIYIGTKLPTVIYVASQMIPKTSQFNCWTIPSILNHLLSGLNPIVQLVYSLNYRKGVKRLLRSFFCTGKSNLNWN